MKNLDFKIAILLTNLNLFLHWANKWQLNIL